MSDLISRQAALALVVKAIHGTDSKEIQGYLFDGLRKELWALPSLVDIVRCKDCIYSRPAYPILCSKPRGLTSVESEDCFCSYGERRRR